jgi:hypothetical protein
MSSRFVLLAVVSTATLARAATAAETEDGSVLGRIDVHGFVSQGAIESTGNEFLVKSRRGSFELTEVGINFSSALTDRLRVGIQLFGGGFATNRFSAKLDWFNLDYRWRDWLGFRAGRVKLPFGLYNEINDIDSARVPILLPQSTYPVANRNFLLAQTGAEVYGYIHLQALGALEYRIYSGTVTFDLTAQSSAFTLKSLNTPYLLGGRLMWETPVDGLRVGGSIQDLRLEADISAGSGPGAIAAKITLPALLWMYSLEYNHDDLLLAAEYSRWRTELSSTDARVLPPSRTVSERYYVLAAYRFVSWFQLGAYYAGLFPNIPYREDRQNQQHDFAGTVRFDVNAHWLIKLEGHYLHGTAGLDKALNGVTDLGDLAPDWALFLIKTTAYF